MGIIAGAKKGKTADRIISSYALVTASTPAFWVALVLLVVFAVWLKLLPIGLSVPIGVEAWAVTMKDRLIHGILPAAALSITGISNIAFIQGRRWRRSWKAIMCCLPGPGESQNGPLSAGMESATSFFLP
mgnify:CR=1 FL=1